MRRLFTHGLLALALLTGLQLPASAVLTDAQNRAAMTYLQGIAASAKATPRTFDAGTYGEWAPYLDEYNGLLVKLYGIKQEVDAKLLHPQAGVPVESADKDMIVLRLDTSVYAKPEQMKAMKALVVPMLDLLARKQAESNELFAQSKRNFNAFPAERQNPALQRGMVQGLDTLQGLFNRFYDSNIEGITVMGQLLDFMLARQGQYEIAGDVVMFRNAADINAYNGLAEKSQNVLNRGENLVQQKKDIQAQAKARLDAYSKTSPTQP